MPLPALPWTGLPSNRRPASDPRRTRQGAAGPGRAPPATPPAGRGARRVRTARSTGAGLGRRNADRAFLAPFVPYLDADATLDVDLR